jgi:hypothetical protein
VCVYVCGERERDSEGERPAGGRGPPLSRWGIAPEFPAAPKIVFTYERGTL